MEVSAENGRFSSNELVVGIEIKQEDSQSATDSPFVFYLHSKADESAGSLVMDKIKSSSNGGGIVVITVILSLTVVVAVAGFVIVRVHRYIPFCCFVSTATAFSPRETLAVRSLLRFFI